MPTLRILVLAPGSNPNSVTGALIGYSHGAALARLHSVTLVIEARDEAAVRNAGGFHAIEAIPTCWVDRLYAWAFRHIFHGDRGNLLWTAVQYPRAVIFEWRAWRRLRRSIRSREFDVALRILPIVPVMASPFAHFLRNGPIPFVVGPLNGGLPWPKGFTQLTAQRMSAGNGIANLRGLYRLLPFSRSTYSNAAAIIAGSSQIWTEFARYHNKLFYVPGENGVSASSIYNKSFPRVRQPSQLELIYVGRLVPYKACDIAILGAASLLRSHRARLTIVGDGSERPRLEQLVDDLGLRNSVTFCGWIDHANTLSRLRKSDVLIFPSLREFGGGVVFEALAMGAVPVVADHGGPGDIVTDEVGYRIPLTTEQQMVSEIGSVLESLASDRSHLESLSRRAQAYARETLTWDAKAQMMTDVLLWTMSSGPKPLMTPPKRR